jgi:beta-galactosidase
LFFDGQSAGAVAFDTRPDNEPQVFAINPPIKGTALTVRLADWEKPPGKNAVTGLDNLRLKARRSPEFYAKVKPMLNNGALVEYPRGAGGIVLCNVLFKESETPPANALHKQNILAAILRNLKAPFAAGKTLLAGANLRYEPIDLSKHATAFRDEKGWFGDKQFTFAALPTGKQKFAGVLYDIYDFPTSPVPTVLMLGGGNSKSAADIRGISINRKADALFFLQTARLDQRMTDDDRKKKKQFEMLRYVVHYADGQQVDVPIHAEIDIHNYKQKAPAAIPGAQIAWSKPYDGTEYSALAYSKQWNNPRPEVEITTIDMVYGKDRRGVPALLALTAARAE